MNKIEQDVVFKLDEQRTPKRCSPSLIPLSCYGKSLISTESIVLRLF